MHNHKTSNVLYAVVRSRDEPCYVFVCFLCTIFAFVICHNKLLSNLQESLASHAQMFIEHLSQTSEELLLLFDNMLATDDIIPAGETGLVLSA